MTPCDSLMFMGAKGKPQNRYILRTSRCNRASTRQDSDNFARKYCSCEIHFLNSYTVNKPSLVGVDVLSSRVTLMKLGCSRDVCIRHLATFSTGGQNLRHEEDGTWRRGPRPPGQSQSRLDPNRTLERCFRISTSPGQTWRTGPQPSQNLQVPLRRPSV